MEKHVTVLGVLYILFSILGLLAAVIVFVALTGGGFLSGERETLAITTTVGTAVAFFLVIVSAPGMIGGIWLLKRQSWARILVLILGILNLFNVPFGTVLGIYTIWVLLQEETVRMFARGSSA